MIRSVFLERMQEFYIHYGKMYRKIGRYLLDKGENLIKDHMPLSQINPCQLGLSIENKIPRIGDCYVGGNNILQGNIIIGDGSQISMSNIIKTEGEKGLVRIGKNCNI